MTELPEDLAAVERLLAERDALGGWLTRLDQAGDATPEAVRLRVRADYQGRLDGVTDRLRGHADTVAAKLAEDRAEHDGLAARETAAREALAEAELRHMVGEYDGGRFEGERTRHTSDIESFALSRGAVAERIARMEEVGALIAGAPRPVAAPVAPVAEPAPVLAAPVDAPPAEEPVRHEAEVLESFDDGQEALTIEALAPDEADHDIDADDLLQIFEEAPADPPKHDPFGPLSFRPGSGMPPAEPARPVAPRPTSRFADAAPIGMPDEPPPQFVRPGEVIGKVPVEPASPPRVVEPAPEAARAELFDEEIVAVGTAPAEPPPPAAASQAARTLRCGECGAMNKAGEWYCEKCGAELTGA